ncbi:MAG: hypothetical protein Q6361_03915 [Candidatus Hermodarchaeota archaeon]|nr:hypothetical protein [Candidatus Hermodarchaeota archaeon]
MIDKDLEYIPPSLPRVDMSDMVDAFKYSLFHSLRGEVGTGSFSIPCRVRRLRPFQRTARPKIRRVIVDDVEENPFPHAEKAEFEVIDDEE